MVEDDVKMAAAIRRGLRFEGLVVDLASGGEQGLAMVGATEYDAVVLDVMMPEVDGFETVRRMRADGVWVPVLMLTARHSVEDRVRGLDGGADDSLTKPFSFSELLARIRARLRTAQSASAVELEVGPLRLDVRLREVRVEGRRAELTPREFALLETFMRHPGQVLSQAQLLDQVWGYDHDPGSNIAEVYVGYLRRKLRPDLIETVRGVGYRLRA